MVNAPGGGPGPSGEAEPGGAARVGQELRLAVLDIARRMVADGLVIGTSGNVSARAGDQIVITPSGRRYDTLEPADLCVLRVTGEPVDLPLRPSSELPMHLAAYRATGAGAVVHTHSMFATAVATSCPELPAVHYTIGFLGGPVRVVRYATFGTPELAEGLREALAGRSAALLQNHGATAVGTDVGQAYEHARLVEWLAELYYRSSRLGPPRILSEAELAAFGEQVAALDYGSNYQVPHDSGVSLRGEAAPYGKNGG